MEAMQAPRTLDALLIERKKLDYTTERISDSDHVVKLFLSQTPHPDSVEGRRTRLFGGQHTTPLKPHEVADYLRILERIPAKADLVVLSEHSAAVASLETLQNLATANRQVIVSALGFCRVGAIPYNSVAVCVPDHQPFLLQKVSFSAEDQEQANNGRLLRGDRIVIFELPIGRLCVLNCHEYTHASIIAEIARRQIDFIVVTSFNPAWKLYAEYARSDIHRLFCFVVLCNVGNYGGSSVLAPFSRVGGAEGAVTLGGVLFSSQGPSDASALIDLPLGELRRLRRYKVQPNPLAAFKAAREAYKPVVPPEVLLMSSPPYRNHLKNIVDVDLKEEGYVRRNSGGIRIGVAQLRSMADNDYIENSYHISRAAESKEFAKRIRNHIRRVTCDLDFLVLPEVFAPLGLDSCFRDYSQRRGTIIITGVEYDAQKNEALYGTEHASGANRCFVYVPTVSGVKRFDYVKMTRSQYDALSNKWSNGYAVPFEMELGTSLLRFRHPDTGDFGVVICYDFSHFDLMHSINMRDRPTPLEMLFIVCHNPHEELYRMCCLADCHRYYQYIAVANVAQYGGSGVFGPVRTKGRARTLLYGGKNTEGVFVTGDVDIAALRSARATEDKYLTSAAQQREESFQRRPGIFNIGWPKVVRVPVERRRHARAAAT